MELLTEYSEKILNCVTEGIYITDENRIISFWNKGAEQLTGYSSKEVIGKNCAENILNHVDENGTNICTGSCPLNSARKLLSPQQAEVYLHHKDGHRVPINVTAYPITDDLGNVIAIVESFHDISEIRNAKQKIETLTHEALVDQLTKLGNRRFADQELDKRFAEKERYGWKFTAALCDIDNFKNINDTYGHDFGDDVLKMVARTMAETLRAPDFIARWGGEEFLILLPHTLNKNDAQMVLDRTRFLIQESFLLLDGEKISVTVSFGASTVQDDDNAKSLFKRIDKLLYKSKREGKNRVTFL